MTEPTRSARPRRGGRRPGWTLLTALLLLAIAASCALVFTERVELLKLAVMLALWAAVVGAFVSVIYRRQSDIDQAKVRDLKLVYDLQLDREISARREYELSLEAQLRRELASEVRALAADEVAGLRAELAALRANLEILFDADLAHRPAIENERKTVRAYSDWAPDAETTGRVTSSRIDAEDGGDADVRTEESPIIDVPAEPQPSEYQWAPPPVPAGPPGGAHRRPSDVERDGRPHEAQEPSSWTPPPPSPSPPPPPQPVASSEPQILWPPPQDTPPPPRETPPEPAPSADWQPAPEEGQWIPAGAPGSNWASPEQKPDRKPEQNGSTGEYVGKRRASEPDASPTPEPPRGRHSATTEAPSESPDRGPRPAPEPPAADTEMPRHRNTDDAETAGHSVAELLARLQATPSPGGRRRRRVE
jgi:hypothetical protein